ncbi:uncharacterized protein [Atheta coriaria]|uniref:uncharacterized protein n=1 Tax=Dalotia coriaria TaxID=877792 RepID=UPI0031F44A20
MLTTYLHGFISKFIIIEDDLEEPGDKLFKNLITSALSTKLNIIYLQFSFNLVKNIPDKTKVTKLYDFTKLSSPEASKTCQDILNDVNTDSILIIDSLSHMYYKLKAKETYKILIKATKLPEFKQILTLLHSDLLQENDEIIHHCSSLSSLHIKIERQFGEARRLSYLFRKGRGKAIREIEEWCITDGKLITRPVAKVDLKTYLQENNPSINSLSTFNIELNEKDKQNRSQMDLPFYLSILIVYL